MPFVGRRFFKLVRDLFALGAAHKLFALSANTAGSLSSPLVASSDPCQCVEIDFLLLILTEIWLNSRHRPRPVYAPQHSE